MRRFICFFITVNESQYGQNKQAVLYPPASMSNNKPTLWNVYEYDTSQNDNGMKNHAVSHLNASDKQAAANNFTNSYNPGEYNANHKTLTVKEITEIRNRPMEQTGSSMGNKYNSQKGSKCQIGIHLFGYSHQFYNKNCQ